jgi:hypothetical protein
LVAAVNSVARFLVVLLVGAAASLSFPACKAQHVPSKAEASDGEASGGSGGETNTGGASGNPPSGEAKPSCCGSLNGRLEGDCSTPPVSPSALCDNAASIAVPSAGIDCREWTVYPDRDGDGVGNGIPGEGVSICACGDLVPAGHAWISADCDDTDPERYWLAYADEDGDGFFDPNSAMCAGEFPDQTHCYVGIFGEPLRWDLTDCDDTDDAKALPSFIDEDGDGDGSEEACLDPGEGSNYSTDCDDADPSRGGFSIEVWGDGVDSNCDGSDGKECECVGQPKEACELTALNEPVGACAHDLALFPAGNCPYCWLTVEHVWVANLGTMNATGAATLTYGSEELALSLDLGPGEQMAVSLPPGFGGEVSIELPNIDDCDATNDQLTVEASFCTVP